MADEPVPPLPGFLPADPDDERGLTASLSYLRELPSGNFGIDLSHDVTNAGDRTDLWVSRVYDYPMGSLGVSVGVAKPEGPASPCGAPSQATARKPRPSTPSSRPSCRALAPPFSTRPNLDFFQS